MKECLIDPAEEVIITREELQMIQEERDFLLWFYQMADFGPADGDVRYYLKRQYVQDTGKTLPSCFRNEEE